MPNEKVDMTKWAVVACDQFTSQPEYWQKLAEFVGDAPSTLNVIFPEAYLSKDNQPIIDNINANMKKYLEQGIWQDIGWDYYMGNNPSHGFDSETSRFGSCG